MSSGIAVGEFEALAGLVLTLAMIFIGWNARHERWFRDIVFPLVQILTGKAPDGSDYDRTNDGHLEETTNRFEKVESEVEESVEVASEALEVAKETREEVRDLKEKQEQRGNRTETILRAILTNVDVDDEEIDRPLFRGGDRGGGNPGDD